MLACGRHSVKFPFSFSKKTILLHKSNEGVLENVGQNIWYDFHVCICGDRKSRYTLCLVINKVPQKDIE